MIARVSQTAVFNEIKCYVFNEKLKYSFGRHCRNQNKQFSSWPFVFKGSFKTKYLVGLFWFTLNGKIGSGDIQKSKEEEKSKVGKHFCSQWKFLFRTNTSAWIVKGKPFFHEPYRMLTSHSINDLYPQRLLSLPLWCFILLNLSIKCFVKLLHLTLQDKRKKK